ncbi:MAG: glycosyltransferase family 25 protein, partial [Hyphomonadaceae bacterium]
MAIPIRCISLQRCTQRRVRFDAHMRALGLDFSFFDAVDGRALCAEALAVATAARRPYFSRAMTPGEIGCYQSHVALYAETVRTGAPAMVILEVDAMVAPALTV